MAGKVGAAESSISSRPPSPSDSNVEDEPSSKKRRHSESSSKECTHCWASSSNDTSTSPMKSAHATSASHFPLITSKWTQSHLDILRIHPKFVIHIETSEVIRESYMEGIIMRKENALKYVDWKANDGIVRGITNCMTSAIESITLNYETVKEIPSEALYDMKMRLRAWRKDFMKTLSNPKDVNLNKADLEEIEEFCVQVEVHGRSLADQLNYMIILAKNHEDNLLEGKYQQLIMMFLLMFNFKVSGFSNINGQTLQIGDAAVTSIPDFLAMETKSSVEVMLVGEVKQEYGQKDKQHLAVKTSSSYTKEAFVRHVSTDLVGQHGGQLLSHLHLSIFGERGIFGIIGQATKVSLTTLYPDDGYMESLKEGNVGLKEATLNISRECNILTRAGRQKLLKPLLDLYFLQRMYNLKGKGCYG